MEVVPFDAEFVGADLVLRKRMLGGKGANLNAMTTELQMPVPPGFTITTDACFLHEGLDQLDSTLRNKVDRQIALLELETDKKFGAKAKMPLLLSVRSGAPVSMPGMMDTILNLGLNDGSVGALARRTNELFAWDSYRRFHQMYAVTVFGIEASEFTQLDDHIDKFFGGQPSAERHEMAVEMYRKQIAKHGFVVPQDVEAQLYGAILAVFRSWNSDRAKSYRAIEKIPDDLGTAVNVQAMVFGNLNNNSGTGVAFTRNPNTGADERYGDFLRNAQGEDVVAGVRKTQPLSEMKEVFNAQALELEGIMIRLEQHYADMCDIEFTIEDGKLWMLQTRVGKRNSKAAITIALDFLQEGKIDRPKAEERIFAAMEKGAPVAAQTESTDEKVLVGQGSAASPGIVFGKAVFTAEQAVAAKEAGEDCILIRHETSPDDIDGMAAAVGILTAQGGLVSHAAVVARAWEKPCVVGADNLTVWDNKARFGEANNPIAEITDESIVQINGATGEIHLLSPGK